MKSVCPTLFCLLAMFQHALCQAPTKPNPTPRKSSVVQLDYLRPQELYERYHDSVVKVVTDKATGTGFFLRDGQTIITCYHVIDGAKQIDIQGSKGERWSTSSCWLDKKADLAILQLSSKTDRHPIHLADFLAVKPGIEVTVISNPLGYLTDSVSTGVVSARRLEDDVELVQFSAAVSHGSSGGPVLNAQGEVIGVVQANITNGQFLNLAIAEPPIHRLLERDSVPISVVFDEAAKVQAISEEKTRAEEQKRQSEENDKKAAHDALAREAKAKLDALMSTDSENRAKLAHLERDLNELESNLATARGNREIADSNVTIAVQNVENARDYLAQMQRGLEQAEAVPNNAAACAVWGYNVGRARRALADRQNELNKYIAQRGQLSASIIEAESIEARMNDSRNSLKNAFALIATQIETIKLSVPEVLDNQPVSPNPAVVSSGTQQSVSQKEDSLEAYMASSEPKFMDGITLEVQNGKLRVTSCAADSRFLKNDVILAISPMNTDEESDFRMMSTIGDLKRAIQDRKGSLVRVKIEGKSGTRTISVQVKLVGNS